ncbi:hypothetical protein [Pseudoalteromonas luteoviolacea]|uniref:hypothetical protein n=1 Tax=Pseudoalteromonas luteoviolacea TaxID=43657 RepID=UPI001151BA78|nr:hypothetical protein [Pseudoalteromonas luteoviolacea]TQF71553.1 hypothetical protein FLM44_10885 [Pseudoalteromonas luteoviolacea]
MIYRIAVYVILMIVIALQSVMSVASMSELQPIDGKHLQASHTHQYDEQLTTSVKLDEHGHAIQDCHHCGHCSGSHTSWVGSELQDYSTLDLSSAIFNVPDRQVRKRIEAKFKPPILS